MFPPILFRMLPEVRAGDLDGNFAFPVVSRRGEGAAATALAALLMAEMRRPALPAPMRGGAFLDDARRVCAATAVTELEWALGDVDALAARAVGVVGWSTVVEDGGPALVGAAPLPELGGAGLVGSGGEVVTGVLGVDTVTVGVDALTVVPDTFTLGVEAWTPGTETVTVGTDASTAGALGAEIGMCTVTSAEALFGETPIGCARASPAATSATTLASRAPPVHARRAAHGEATVSHHISTGSAWSCGTWRGGPWSLPVPGIVERRRSGASSTGSLSRLQRARSRSGRIRGTCRSRGR